MSGGARIRVPFTYDVVFDMDGALRAINVTCQTCGERGYKNPLTELVEHAKRHDTVAYPIPQSVDEPVAHGFTPVEVFEAFDGENGLRIVDGSNEAPSHSPQGPGQ